MSADTKAPPEAFTRRHALEDDMPGLPESVPYLETEEHQTWLQDRKNYDALGRLSCGPRALARGAREGVPVTSCEYCEKEAGWQCDVCFASACAKHVECVYDARYCNPDPATWPGRGCYKPPVAEVAE